MLQRIYEFLHSNSPFYYATCDADQPRVRPFGSVMIYEDKLYFGMGDNKASYRQTLLNPNVEICTCSKDGVWIRLRGKAVFDERPEVMERVFQLQPELREIYNEQTGDEMANFYLDEGYCEFQSLSGEFECFEF